MGRTVPLPPTPARLHRTGEFPHTANSPPTGQNPRIGHLAPNLATNPGSLETFLPGLRDLGYVEGRNVVIEYRDAAGKLERPRRSRPNWLRSRLM